MLFPQTEHHYVRTHKRHLDAIDAAALDTDYAALEADGRSALQAEGFAAGDQRFERLIDLRYAGANSEITVPLPATPTPGAPLRELFAQAHERVIARGATASSIIPDRLAFAEDRYHSGRSRVVYFGPEVGGIETAVCGRSDLDASWRAGPLLIEEFDSTTVVPPDGRVRRIDWDTIEIELQ
jgi:N-methylhydantoinase A